MKPAKIVALAGGVGGAKLADGLARVNGPENLTVIVNTGDDFVYSGLSISPDLDTVCYTLAGIANHVTGWGLEGDTWNTLEHLKKLGSPGWFNLGDQDLATHIERTRLLRDGKALSEITRHFCEAWGVSSRVLPMTDAPVATRVTTIDGIDLEFQEYFVKYRWQPVVGSIRFSGIESAHAAPGVLEALDACDYVVICPSNPYVSVEPILQLPGIVEILQHKPVTAVSPIIGSDAVKGPLAKMIVEITGKAPDAAFAAGYYAGRGIINRYILDIRDRSCIPLVEGWGIICEATDILMATVEDRSRVAATVMSAGKLHSGETNP